MQTRCETLEVNSRIKCERTTCGCSALASSTRSRRRDTQRTLQVSPGRNSQVHRDLPRNFIGGTWTGRTVKRSPSSPPSRQEILPGWEPRDSFFSVLGAARGLSLRAQKPKARQEIISYLPVRRRSMFFSATVSEDVKDIILYYSLSILCYILF